MSSPSSSSTKEKEPFQVRVELYAPTRLLPKALAVFHRRALVVDVLAYKSLVLVLLAARTSLTASAIRSTKNSDVPVQLPRVGVLGAGHVGSAVVLTLLQHKYPPERLAISTRQPERVTKCDALESLQTQALVHSVTTYYDNARLARESDVVVLCMPPSQLKSVAIQLKHALSVSEAPPLVISALCGVSRELLQKACGSRLVTRVKVGSASATLAAGLASNSVVAMDIEVSTASVTNGKAQEPVVAIIAARELGTVHVRKWLQRTDVFAQS